MLSPLAVYACKGLKNCYMPEKQSWSYIYHLDGRTQPCESFPPGDCFYSLNVILGLAATGEESWKNDYDLPALLQKNADNLPELAVAPYALGMALWASAELNSPLAEKTTVYIRKFIQDRAGWYNFRAQDAGMILTGICEQKRRGNNDYDSEAAALFTLISDHYVSPSALFYDSAKGLRRNFSSFATHTYLATACYHYGARYGNQQAFSLADAATQKLLSLQGPYGEWPWFYFSPKGIVVDPYEIYTVHQYGMAPLFLSLAEQRGVAGAAQALRKGVEWALGNNSSGQDMLLTEKYMFYRSLARKDELNTKTYRAIRALTGAALSQNAAYVSPQKLELRQECRSYELGWLLYSLGGRTDMPDITHHPRFS